MAYVIGSLDLLFLIVYAVCYYVDYKRDVSTFITGLTGGIVLSVSALLVNYIFYLLFVYFVIPGYTLTG